MTVLPRCILFQLFQPHGCHGVGGRSPVAAWGEGAAGADFGAVGNGGALELTGLEEAEQEQRQPFFDGRQGVFVLFVFGKGVRPRAVRPVAPGFVGQVGDFGGAEAVAGEVVEVEVLQLVGADFLLRALQRRIGRVAGIRIGGVGDQLRGDFGVYDGLNNRPGSGAKLFGGDDPAQEVLNQRLGHGGVDIVVRHLVPDTVSGPAQGQLA